MDKCKNCGAELSSSVRFCNKCGTRVERQVNVVVCNNGHHYDYNRYGDKCPHCLREGMDNDSSDLVQKEVASKDVKSEIKSEQPVSRNSQFFGFIHKKKEERKAAEEAQKDPVTQEMRGGGIARPIVDEEKKEDISPPKSEIVSGGAAVETSNNREKTESRNLEDAICVLYPPEPKTMSIWGKSKGGEPPVGWLVCIQGGAQGLSYELHAGKNSIGRDSERDVYIMGDESISRMHTVIKYEHKKRKMKLLPSDGDGVVYLNDEDVDEVTELKDRDIIEIGQTKLMLVCLCREDFSWEDWINEG